MTRPCFLILSCFALVQPAAHAAGAGKVRFNRDIRPILSENCFYCHGPDPKHREADLRLDDRAAAIEAKAIIPGKPEASEVIARIMTDDKDDLMPPPDSHKSLKPEQKELLRRWITEGAEYEPHWAYTPLVKPAVPPVRSGRVEHGNAIDAFIRATLEEKNIQPSEQAGPRTLIRRLSLDLTGLPPTVAEVNAFIAAWEKNESSAYDALVDRLLKSPHHGERMAVWWLDVARFTDTVGFHGDQNQRIFPYRDYVIKAFNENKRFDQFTIEQLAGDLLPKPTPEQLAATGFNRLNMMTREGGAQPKEYLAKYGAERVRTVAGAWLGATFTCAECHDHKYDPISQKDFYSLQAYFADVKQWGVYSDYGYSPNPELKGWTNEYPFPPELEVQSPYLKKRMETLQKQRSRLIAEVSEALNASASTKNAFESWLTASRAFFTANPDGWSNPVPEVSTSAPSAPRSKEAKAAAKAAPKPATKTKAGKTPFTVEADGRIVFEAGPADSTFIKLPLSTGSFASFKVELLPDASHNGSIMRAGTAGSGLMRISATLARKNSKKPVALEFRHAEANLKEPRYAAGEEVIGIQGGWKTSEEKHTSVHEGIWWLDTPQAVTDGDLLTVKIDGNLAGCVRVSVSPFAPPSVAGAKAWLAELSKRLQNEQFLAREAYLTSTAWDAAALKQFKQLSASILECRDGKAKTLITQKMEPLTVRVLARGNWQDESGEVVQPATPHFLPARAGGSKDRQSRLDLARWLCSKENPVTARAVVNRLWKQFYGNGLSLVLDDLGAQGEPPSHPELLDWLAGEFRDSGWDLRHMIRLMVSSATYRQDASLRPELRDIDPANRLLASQNPRRLDAEFVRDNALSIAGLMNPDIGGPSAKPYQPEGYYANLQFPNREYEADKDDRQWRRGVYMHWQRTFLHPMLANFDAPNRDECTCIRTVSNTPQQALTLLNDPTFVEAARVFAQRIQRECKGPDAERIEHAFQIALARAPKDKEKQSLLTFLAAQRKTFASGESDAVKLVQTGLAPEQDGGNARELAAWTSVARVILNLHEVITRY